MTNDTRLRRLDALFAEKVLGKRIHPDGNLIVISPPTVSEIDDRFGTSVYQTIPPYTRSLGAAWEGAAEHFPIIEISMEPRSIPFHAEVERDGFESMDDADHPAEALVLACLRAVGVEESELQ